MPGDVHDLGLDATAPAPVVAKDTVASVLPVALEPTLARGSLAAEGPAAAVPATTRMRWLFVGSVTLAAANTLYFVARFILSPSPPALTPIFQSAAARDDLGVGFLRGPMVTLASISLVAVLFLAIAAWAARHHRRDSMAQLMASLAVLAGQLSLAVTLLTSADTFLPARIVAAAVYVLVPFAGFLTLALFPSGRPVPRVAIYVLPVAVVPFVLQARLMFVERGYSVAIAAAAVPFALAFLGFQWHRYRKHASLREQHQIKWLGLAGVAFGSIQVVAVGGILPLLADTTRPAFPVLKLLYCFMIAGSYVVALTCVLFSSVRYRVWDVDRIINRTIVYALVTVLVAAAFAVAWFVLLAGLRAFDAPDVVAAAVALVIVAAIFPRTRRKISRWIDRRFYGIGLDYEGLAAKAVRAAALPTLGDIIGPFEGLVLLGRGGMGAVYRAHHPDYAEPLALKVMSPALAGDADAAARFHREARILEGLRHPHVVPFLASGHERGLAFIAMQYIDGEDLGARVRRRGTLPLAEVATIVAGIAEALDVAHARGVVHRDIKPANIFLEHSDPARALVMDFGVARLVGDPPLAGDDSVVGSLPYTSPEQIQRGETADGRADIYSLGATAFELLCGRPPFRESTALGYVMAHLRQVPPDARELTPSLPATAAAAIARALEKDPAARFATAGELAAALR